MDTGTTIAALATAAGGSARGIVRLSGPRCGEILRRCFRALSASELSDLPPARIVSGELLLPSPLGALPCQLYWWPTSRSYTRQPAAEVHTLGSPPLLAAVLRTICDAGARLARPGEFTLRAFLAGRLDLTQAEAVLSVVDSQDQRQLQSALQQLAGGLATPLHRLRERLLDLLAQLEAGLDFVEEDIEFVSRSEQARQVAEALQEVHALQQSLHVRGEAGDLPRVVLRGLPNVGKSSLWNALRGESAEAGALVSETPGSTRDYLAGRLDLDGIRCLLIDTAGVGEPPADEPLAQAAQRGSVQQHAEADLPLLCLDRSRGLLPWETEELARALAAGDLIVWTKSDQSGEREPPSQGILTSTRSGAGLPALRRALRERLVGQAGELQLRGTVSLRCQESLRDAQEALARAAHGIDLGAGDELIAADLRAALEELGRIVGAVYTDDILDRIFSRFCIGK